MTCSILGCGWLGLPLAKFLLTQGMEVKGSTTREEKLGFLQEQGIDPYLVQLSPEGHEGDLEAFLDSDLLILNFPPGRNHEDVGKAFPATMRHLLETLQQSQVSHIVFVSSISVYGDHGGGEVTEESSLEPTRSSGKALMEVEAMLQSSGIALTILRMAGLAGYNRKPGRFLAGRRNLGMGNAPVNLVHQDDCIRSIWEVIRQERWGEIYNVCADHHPTRSEFYTFAARHLGLPEPHFLPDSQSQGRWVSNKKIKTELNFQFSYPDPFEMVVMGNGVVR